MNRKAVAQETLQILKQGYYELQKKKIEIEVQQRYSEENSVCIPPEEGQELVKKEWALHSVPAEISVKMESAVKTIFDCAVDGKKQVAVLNFASAKNPGGGFINGAMAQEESLAASSGLYPTLLKHPIYYEVNRGCGTMMYTDYAIYSPDVVFFRDQRFSLLDCPVTASVLTLPAVNYGQVLLKKEDSEKAKQVMKERMRLALSIFAEKKAEVLILGAYGCGVFRNDPKEVAVWWKALLEEESFRFVFREVIFSVLDNSKDKKCIQPFQTIFSADKKEMEKENDRA